MQVTLDVLVTQDCIKTLMPFHNLGGQRDGPLTTRVKEKNSSKEVFFLS